LAKRYDNGRLETACTLALQIGAVAVRHVRDILIGLTQKTKKCNKFRSC
jgi:hypothetical protein